MFKKTITYRNFNDEEVTDTFYFHLSKPELLDLDVDQSGGLANFITKIIETRDGKELVEMFKKIVLTAYGVKSADGTYFDKSEELRERFKHTAAYPEIFMELATDDDKAAEFLIGAMPKEMGDEIKKSMAGDQDKPSGPPPVPNS